jgi:hypothetical protein
VAAAGTRARAPCRDLSDQKDDRIESYVCMGYEQGAHVKCLAFQPTSNLLVRAVLLCWRGGVCVRGCRSAVVWGLGLGVHAHRLSAR